MTTKQTTATGKTKQKQANRPPQKKKKGFKWLLFIFFLVIIIVGCVFFLFVFQPPILHQHNTLGGTDCIICDDSYYLQRVWREGRLYRQKIDGIKTANCYTLNWKGEIIQSSLPLDEAAIEVIKNDTQLKNKTINLDIDSILQAELPPEQEFPEYKATYSYEKKSLGRVWGMAYGECKLFEVYEVTQITTRTFYLADFNFKTMGKTSNEKTYAISEYIIDVATEQLIPEGDAIALNG